jgi:hypothetical protein
MDELLWFVETKRTAAKHRRMLAASLWSTDEREDYSVLDG